MNKYEVGAGFFREDREANREAKINFNKSYNEFREIVLNNKDYALGKARDILEEFDAKEAKKMFEMFNQEEGTLPDNLAVEYIKLVYSPASFHEKMAGGESFYEALADISRDVKGAKIELRQSLVDERLKSTTKELMKDEESDE